jgi:cullin-associated NEDD8-dissociated protein 1
LVSFCKNTEDDELKDACVHAFETFIVCCNKEIAPHLPAIVEICSEMIKHDPNYAYEEDEVENGDEKMEVDDEGEVSDEELEYSDDDDLSWKARRSAAKCLEALVS